MSTLKMKSNELSPKVGEKMVEFIYCSIHGVANSISSLYFS